MPKGWRLSKTTSRNMPKLCLFRRVRITFLRLIIISYLLSVILIEYIAAFRAELGRIFRVFRLPAAFIAFIKRCACRFGAAAVLAELTLIQRSAGTGPAVLRRLRLSAVGAEFACISALTALTAPSCC